MTNKNYFSLTKNWISILGAIGSVLSLVLIIVLLVFIENPESPNPILGTLLYLVSPALLLGSLVLIPFGMYKTWRASQRESQTLVHWWQNVNLRDPHQRTVAIMMIIGAFVTMLVAAIATYHGYHYTESVSFCGKLCHTVMAPEHTTYQNSPHARVKCIECHIGPGAGWYAKSKLNGLYQVYSVIAHKYERPVAVPVKNLRPSQDTCEQCHWPQKFYDAKQREFPHYQYDEQNSKYPITLLIKIGGKETGKSHSKGIHWHVDPDNLVEYIAADEARQEIPWIRVTNKKTGEVTVYENNEKPLSPDQVAKGHKRKMDCIDCHNRPSHRYRSPDVQINVALSSKLIDDTIPNIKKMAVEVMSKEYNTEAEALKSIDQTITEYYKTKYPAIFAKDEAKIKAAVHAIQEAFKISIFPEMKARWSTYPDNIGHFNFPGCMRCHEGKHEATSKGLAGKKITNDCNTCHLILSQGPESEKTETWNSKTGVEFKHPVDVGDAWKNGSCYECHTGGL